MHPGLVSRLNGVARCGALLSLLAMGQTVCFGSAFSISEIGTRASGMGSAFIGIADDPSALYYNTAGIAFVPGAQMQMDSTVVVGLFRFFPSATPVGQVVPENGYSQSIKPHFIPVASLFATAQVSPKLTVGFASFTPFGLSANSTNFNDSDPNLTKFVGRFAGTRARLEQFWFQPTAAYRLTENSSIGVGVAFVHTHLFIEQSFLNPLDDALEFGRTAASTVFPGQPKEQAARVIARLLPEGRSRVAGTANSPAFSLGYLYKSPKLKTNIGISFHSAVTSHLSGKASFAFGTGYTLEQYVGSDFLGKQFPNQDVTGSFTTPATYGIGVANSSLWGTTLAFDFRIQDYSRFKDVPLNFGTNEQNADVALPAEQRLVFNFRNAVSIAMGAEKTLSPNMKLRAGYHYDRTPVVDAAVGPFFPDATRHSFTVGASRKSGNKEFSFFYEAMNFEDRDTNVAANAVQYTNGSYRNFAHIGGLSLRFDVSDLMPKKH